MSRSDNTARAQDGEVGQRGLQKTWATFSLPRRTGRYLRRKWNKQQRGQARAALSRQEEPEPTRPRHGVNYDYW